MKKIIALILSVAMILSMMAVIGCGEQGETENSDSELAEMLKGDGTFRVGFDREPMDPEESVPMGGYGNSTSRMSQGLQDHIYVQITAIQDGEGETVLLAAFDCLYLPEEASKYTWQALSENTGIPEDHIFFCASHTHSGPDCATVQNAALMNFITGKLPRQAVKAAKRAILDLSEAKMKIGTIEVEGLNYVRHYTQENGGYVGANYGDQSASPISGHVVEADNDLQMLCFERGEDKDNIVLTNFQAHATCYGSDNTDLSPDFVGFYRKTAEEKLPGTKFVYLQGASGNMDNYSYWSKESTTRDPEVYGGKLADSATELYGNLKETATGKVTAVQNIYEEEVDHSEDQKISNATLVRDWAMSHWDDKTGISNMAHQYGFNSIYHCTAIIRKSNSGKTQKLFTGAFRVGEVGFASIGAEMFDIQGMAIKENAGYDMTIIAGYAQNCTGYIPSEYAYDVPGGFYEVNQTYWKKGLAEDVADRITDMLKELHK